MCVVSSRDINVQVHYDKFTNCVKAESNPIQALQNRRGFHLKKLKAGRLSGLMCCRLNDQWRIFFSVQPDDVTHGVRSSIIHVQEINEHDY